MTGPSTETWRLEGLVLLSCAAGRGEGDADAPGRLHVDRDVSATIIDDVIEYTISATAVFRDTSEEPVATVAMVHLVQYTDVDGDPSEELINEFTPSVAMHVTPFEREFLASMTNRLGLDPFYLPLLRRDQVILGPQVAESSTPSL